MIMLAIKLLQYGIKILTGIRKYYPHAIQHFFCEDFVAILRDKDQVNMQVKNNMVKTVRLSTDQITQIRQIQTELPLDG